MVGWTIINRMKQHHATRVSAVWNGYSHSHSPSYTSLQLATAILTGRATDISQGVTHFYSPGSMPKEGESTLGWDVADGDMESTPGVTKHRRPTRNDRPRWAARGIAVKVPGVRDEDFKFYRVN